MMISGIIIPGFQWYPFLVASDYLLFLLTGVRLAQVSSIEQFGVGVKTRMKIKDKIYFIRFQIFILKEIKENRPI